MRRSGSAPVQLDPLMDLTTTGNLGQEAHLDQGCGHSHGAHASSAAMLHDIPYPDLLNAALKSVFKARDACPGVGPWPAASLAHAALACALLHVLEYMKGGIPSMPRLPALLAVKQNGAGCGTRKVAGGDEALL